MAGWPLGPDVTAGGGEPGTGGTSLRTDALLALGVGAFILLGTVFATQSQPDARDLDALGVALLLVAAGSLTWRRRYPVATLATAFVTTLIYLAVGYAAGPIWLTLIIAFFSAVLRGHRVVAIGFLVVGFASFPWIDRVLRDGPPPTVLSLLALAAWLLVLFAVAEGLRLRRQRDADRARQHAEETRARATEERLRIARELHDALGHHLSLISVQAGAALHVGTGLPEPVRSSLAAIRSASTEALTELRSVLDILRQDEERAPRSPTSTLARLDDLVAQASTVGVDVRTETRGDPHPLPFGVDRAAFRIVQESLTNVARHAGAATATVTVDYGAHDLVVQVDDDGRGGTPSGEGGSGLRGMRERAAALGGELEAGPRPQGGFRVRARLPLEDVA